MGCELRRQLREPGAFCVASMADCLWLRGHDGRPFFFVYQALCVSGVCVSLRLGLKLRRLSVAAAAAAALVPVLPLRRVAGWMGALSPLGGSGAARSWLPVVVVRSFVRSFVAKHCCNRVARAAAGGGRRADARSRGGGGGGGGCVGGRTSYGRRRNRGPGSCRRVHSTDQAQAPSNNRGVVVCSVRTSSIWGGCLVLTGTGQELQPSRLPPLLTTTNPLEGR